MKNIIKKILEYLFPLNEIINSEINGSIVVRKNPGNMEIRVGGYIQSGKYAENLVNLLLSKPQLKNLSIKRILILGVGGGSMIHVLRNRFPLANITGVDIDKEMIKAGIKYFGLDTVQNYTLIIKDAVQYVKNKNLKKFDLIVMDLFIGCDVPVSAEKLSFIINVQKLLEKNGTFCINRSYLDKYKKETLTFVNKLHKVFSDVNTYYSKPNLLIIAK